MLPLLICAILAALFFILSTEVPYEVLRAIVSALIVFIGLFASLLQIVGVSLRDIIHAPSEKPLLVSSLQMFGVHIGSVGFRLRVMNSGNAPARNIEVRCSVDAQQGALPLDQQSFTFRALGVNQHVECPLVDRVGYSNVNFDQNVTVQITYRNIDGKQMPTVEDVFNLRQVEEEHRGR